MFPFDLVGRLREQLSWRLLAYDISPPISCRELVSRIRLPEAKLSDGESCARLRGYSQIGTCWILIGSLISGTFSSM